MGEVFLAEDSLLRAAGRNQVIRLEHSQDNRFPSSHAEGSGARVATE